MAKTPRLRMQDKNNDKENPSHIHHKKTLQNIYYNTFKVFRDRQFFFMCMAFLFMVLEMLSK